MVSYDKDDEDKEKDNPFDRFGIDEDFLKRFLNDEEIQKDLQHMAEEMMKKFSTWNPEDEPFTHSFKIDFGEDGKPHFRNSKNDSPFDQKDYTKREEPDVDVIENTEDVAVTVELPGLNKDDIDLKATEKQLEINVDNPDFSFHKNVDLPCKVKPKTTHATYKNGILDVTLKRKNKKKDTGFNVNIE
ncbi:MAG: Hsp20/alpha crystallin family protein [Candidatus Thermoplasmatota archaeon]